MNWIMELAANKSTHYPNFRTLHLQEPGHSEGPGFGSPFKAIDRPDLDSLQGLKLEFEKNSIDLQIELRMDPQIIMYKHFSLVPRSMLLST